MIRTTDRIVYPSRAHLGDAITGLRRVLGFEPASAGLFLDYLESECNEAGLDFAVIAAHAANECDYFRDERFQGRRDAFGIGKTGPGVDGAAFKTYEDSAFFAVFEYRVKLGQSPTLGEWSRAAGIYREKVDRLSRIVSRPDWPKVERIADLNQRFGDNDCVWMCDPDGPEAIVAKGRALFPNLPDQKGTPVTEYRTVVPGVPGGPLVTDYPVIVDLIPLSMKTNRSGIKAKTPRRSVQHGNGNPRSSARGERNFLHAGAPDAQGRPQTLSYHATGDDKEIWVLVPFDEVTWQAADGSGPGNHNGYSFELVEDNALWADPARRDRAIFMAADFMGRVAARLGATKPERHWDFNWAACGFASYTEQSCGARHHCPDRLMDTGLWGALYVPQWQGARANELQRMQGGTPTTTTTAAPTPKPLRLPKGMSTGVARALFNPHDLRKPGGGRISFNLNGSVSQQWLRHALATIPEGAAWTEGVWDGLDSVIRRGDGRLIYAFGNLTIEQAE